MDYKDCKSCNGTGRPSWRAFFLKGFGACNTCDGNGIVPATNPDPCPMCDGTGKVGLIDALFGVSRFGFGSVCGFCLGKGLVNSPNLDPAEPRIEGS